jgi:hypothetical protein
MPKTLTPQQKMGSMGQSALDEQATNTTCSPLPAQPDSVNPPLIFFISFTESFLLAVFKYVAMTLRQFYDSKAAKNLNG